MHWSQPSCWRKSSTTSTTVFYTALCCTSDNVTDGLTKTIAWHHLDGCVQTGKASGAMWDLKLATGRITPILQWLLIYDTWSANRELNGWVPNSQKEIYKRKMREYFFSEHSADSKPTGNWTVHGSVLVQDVSPKPGRWFTQASISTSKLCIHCVSGLVLNSEALSETLLFILFLASATILGEKIKYLSWVLLMSASFFFTVYSSLL